MLTGQPGVTKPQNNCHFSYILFSTNFIIIYFTQNIFNPNKHKINITSNEIKFSF